jgi:hypothetical protein
LSAIAQRQLQSGYAQCSSDFYTRSLGSVTENIAVRGKLSSSRPRKDEHRFDLISGALPFGGLWYDGPDAAEWFENRLHLRLSTRTLLLIPMPA